MKCPYCNRKINDYSSFCRYCGQPLEVAADMPEDTASERTGLGERGRWLIAGLILFLILSAAAGAYIIKEKYNREVEALFSGTIKNVALEDSYVLENDQIDLASPEVRYTDGTEEKVANYTAYINDTKCEIKNGKVCVPKDAPENCTLRLEWENDGQKQYCEKAITIAAAETADAPEEAETAQEPTAAEPEPAEPDPMEAAKEELLESYGQAALAEEDKENEDGWRIWSKGDVLSEGIIDFYEMDMDGDGVDELLCTRVLEEDESQDVSDFFGILDCQVYKRNGDEMECVYSTYDAGYGVSAGCGGLIMKDGPIPHFADTNHAVPGDVFTMENGQINVHSIDAPAGTEDMCMADLRGVLRDVYEEFIGGSENYTVLEEIEGSDQYFSTQVEALP